MALSLLQQSILNQLEAALSMMRADIEQCDDTTWLANVGNYPFWRVAYHTLFYCDCSLSPDVDAFVPRDFHRENIERFPDAGDASQDETADIEPYDRQTLLDYVAHCREKAIAAMADETEESLAGPSRFPWYQVPRAEFWMINFRHVHHHAAQLSLVLRNRNDTAIDWVGSGWN